MAIINIADPEAFRDLIPGPRLEGETIIYVLCLILFDHTSKTKRYRNIYIYMYMHHGILALW